MRMSEISAFGAICWHSFVVTESWEENNRLKQFWTNILGWSKILKYIRFFSLMPSKYMVTKKRAASEIPLKFHIHIQLPKHFVLIETKQRVHKTKESVAWPHMNFMFILTNNLCLCGHWFIRFQNVNKGTWKHFFFRKRYIWKNLAHCYQVLDAHIFTLKALYVQRTLDSRFLFQQICMTSNNRL